jgi:hypothetical protein
MGVSSVTTTDWVVRSTAKSVMAMLALAGFTAMYLRQRSRVGVVGLVGYLLLSTGYFLMFGTEYLAAFALPGAADDAPGWVDDVITAAYGGAASPGIGALGAVFAATGVFYVLGGLVFGITTFRAGILARWAALLLAVGNVATLALAVLPDSFNRPMAVPTGIALIGLGVSLWRDQRRAAAAEGAEVAEAAGGSRTGGVPTPGSPASAARPQAAVR